MADENIENVNISAWVASDGTTLKRGSGGEVSVDDFNAMLAKIKYITPYCFAYIQKDCVNSGLTSVSFLKLSSIGEYGLYYAFYGCTGLTSVSFLKLSSIGEYGLYYAFSNCTALTSVSFPELSSVSSYGLNCAFYECTGLTSVSFPKLTTIGGKGLYYAFSSCTGLTSVSFPELTTVSSYGLEYAFNRCTNLKEVHFHYSLEGNSECTVSNMGCSNATVYFDLGK